MILVIAVLVLLALLGTAFITTSRSDRATSVRAESNANVDVLQAGVLNTITSGIQRQSTVTRFANSSVGSPTYVTFSPAPVASGMYGMPMVASRAPTAFESSSAVGVRASYPRWPVISAPLGTTAYDAGTAYPLVYAYPSQSIYGFTDEGTHQDPDPTVSPAKVPTRADRYSPAQVFTTGPQPAASGNPLATSNPGYFSSPVYNLTLDAKNFALWPDGTKYTPGGGEQIVQLRADGLPDGAWGKYDSARRDLIVGTLSLRGVTYPALLSLCDQTWAIAGDADGDGVADSGLNYVGTLPGAEFAGITFYVAYRVIDNNSAINANTAVMGTKDYGFTSQGVQWATSAELRNNRLFPSSVDLRLSLPPKTPTGTGAYPGYSSGGQSSDLGSNDDYFRQTFLSYRAGSPLSGDPYAQNTDASPIADTVTDSSSTPYKINALFPPYPLVDTDVRKDVAYNSQLEAEWQGHGRRVDFPGMHYRNAPGSLSSTYLSFGIGDQAELAFAGSTLIHTGSSVLEQILPFSLLGTGTGRGNTGGSTMPAMHSLPYTAGEIGFRNDATAAGSANWSSWYTQNFGYEPQSTAAPLTSPLVNLRPFLVTRNPVSQAVGFKPLPTSVTRTTAPLSGDVYDQLNPYARVFDAAATANYAPGDLVYYIPASGKPDYYYLSGAQPVTGATAPTASPWKLYAAPIVPQKVDANKASFGDLWRGFFLTMASDNVRYDTGANELATDTVNPFGPHTSLVAAKDELYRGMKFDLATSGAVTNATVTDLADTSTFNAVHMFRSNVKDYVDANNTLVPPDQMVVLRSAQAAANAEYLRSNGQVDATTTAGRDDIIRHNIALKMRLYGADNTAVMAEVYSTGKFPYLAEVYVNSDPGIYTMPAYGSPVPPAANPDGFVALKVYNPYPFRVSLANFKIQKVARSGTIANDGNSAGRTLVDVFQFDNSDNIVIAANSFLLLTNYSGTGAVTTVDATGTNGPAGPGDANATVIPTNLALPATAVHVPQLGQIIGSEVVISRPMQGDIKMAGGSMTLHCDASPRLGDPGQIVFPSKNGHEAAEYYVPFDGIDLSNLHGTFSLADVTDTRIPADPHPGEFSIQAYAYHYARAGSDWKFVYPGRYDGRQAIRQQGLRDANYRSFDDIVDGAGNENEVTPRKSAGFSNPQLTLNANAPTAADIATYDRSMPVQISNFGFGGPNGTVTSNLVGDNRFPFGGFARVGDLLQVTYISPVKIRLQTITTAYVDIIPLTADAAFAEDTDTLDDREENIGRFAPIITPNPIVISTNAAYDYGYAASPAIDEFAIAPANSQPNGTAVHTAATTPEVVPNPGYLDQQLARYGWANGLFDQFTVTSVTNLHTPNVAGGTNATGPYAVDNYPSANAPVPVAAKGSSFPSQTAVAGPQLTQADAGINGLVNVNTAPLPVLAAIPWVRSNDPNVNLRVSEERDMDLRIAQAIIAYREPHYGDNMTLGGAGDHNLGAALPIRPIRSLFELNRILMITMNSDAGTLHVSTKWASFRTGGLDAGSNEDQNWNASTTSGYSALVQEPTANQTPAAYTTNTSPFTSNNANTLFQTVESGNFRPDGTSPTVPAANDTSTGGMLTGAFHSPAYATDTLGNRKPRGDFESQYLMMTAVSNLITTRSDTFTAYIDIEGWTGVGTANAARVLQHRYAYILDRSGTMVSMPVDTRTTGGGTPTFLYPDTTKSTVVTPGPVTKTYVPAVGN